MLCHAGALAVWRGNLDEASALLEEALTLYRGLDDPYWTATVLSHLALVAGERGDLPRAAALYAESLALWRSVGSKEGMIDWLARVAMLAVGINKPEPAARLFAAVEALRDAIGYRVEAPEQARSDRRAAQARGALGGEAFARAVEAGRALPLETAIAEATGLLSAPTVEASAAAPAPAPPSVSGEAARFGLTPREVEVLRLLAAGRSDKEIGAALSISHRTAMNHVANILGKLGVDSRTAAAALALRDRLV